MLLLPGSGPDGRGAACLASEPRPAGSHDERFSSSWVFGFPDDEPATNQTADSSWLPAHAFVSSTSAISSAVGLYRSYTSRSIAASIASISRSTRSSSDGRGALRASAGGRSPPLRLFTSGIRSTSGGEPEGRTHCFPPRNASAIMAPRPSTAKANCCFSFSCLRFWRYCRSVPKPCCGF